MTLTLIMDPTLTPSENFCKNWKLLHRKMDYFRSLNYLDLSSLHFDNVYQDF